VRRLGHSHGPSPGATLRTGKHRLRSSSVATRVPRDLPVWQSLLGCDLSPLRVTDSVSVSWLWLRLALRLRLRLPAPSSQLLAPSSQLPAPSSQLPLSTGVGLGFHPSSSSGSGCGSTTPTPPHNQTPEWPVVVPHRRIAAAAGARASDLTGGPCGRSLPLGRVQARHGGPEPAPVRGHSAGPAAGPNRRRGDARTAQVVPRQQPTAAARQLLRGRYRGRPVSSAGPVAILPRDQGRPLSSVHHRRLRLCAASKRACERLPRQHETAAACGVSATNRQGGRVGLVYIDHAPPVWGCPGPAARPTSACSAEQRARPATAAAAAIVFSAKRRPPAAPCRVLDPADGLARRTRGRLNPWRPTTTSAAAYTAHSAARAPQNGPGGQP
jgi:hypothetical protein